jgi:hypothetical protein
MHIKRVLSALTLQQAELLGGLNEELAEFTAVSVGQGQAWMPGSLMSKSPQVGLDSGTQHTCGVRQAVVLRQHMHGWCTLALAEAVASGIAMRAAEGTVRVTR